MTRRLRSQSSPQEERKRQHQRARSEVKRKCPFRACRGSFVIRRLLILIRRGCGAVAPRLLAGVAEAATTAATAAPTAHRVMSSERDGGEWIRIA